MKRLIKLSASILFLIMSCVLNLPGSAQALPIIDLDFGMIAPTTGSISYGGGNAPLVGTDIQVDNVLGRDQFGGVGTGVPINPLNIYGGLLSFTTGANTGGWTWGGGSGTTITLTGGLDFNGDNILDLPTNTVLLSGTFGSAFVNSLGGFLKISGASFTDYKHPELLTYFGLPTALPNGDPMPYLGGLNLSFSASQTVVGNPFTSTSLASGDLVNTPVPEPGALLLLGFGLAGLGFVSRKKKSA